MRATRLGCYACGMFCIWFAAGASAESSLPPEKLRDSIIAQSEVVKSFTGAYTLQYINEDGNNSTQTQEFRFSGPDRYFAKHRSGIDGTPIEEITSSYGGSIKSFIRMTGTPSMNVGLPTWPAPPDSTLCPLHMVGHFGDLSLADRLRLAIAELRVSSREGYIVLTSLQWYEKAAERFDFWFDDAYRLKRIDRGYMPPRAFVSAHADEAAQGPPKFFDIVWTYEFTDFTRIDGVEFPLVGTMKVYRTKDELISQWQEKHGRGEMTDEEFYSLSFGSEARTLMGTHVLTLDRPTVRVNPELGPKDFEIPAPDGTHVVDSVSGNAYFLNRP